MAHGVQQLNNQSHYCTFVEKSYSY